MDVDDAAIIYIIVVVLVFLLMRFGFGIRIFASIVFSLLVGAIIYLALTPEQLRKNKHGKSSKTSNLGVLMAVITIVFVLYYVVNKIFTTDVDPKMIQQAELGLFNGR